MQNRITASKQQVNCMISSMSKRAIVVQDETYPKQTTTLGKAVCVDFLMRLRTQKGPFGRERFCVLVKKHMVARACDCEITVW